MTMLGDLLRWFSGGSEPYMSLAHCFRGDVFWIALTVMLDISVALGYLLIARHWARNERALPESPAKTALGQMKRIFILCSMCGYLFIPIQLFWPAWRLYDGFMIALVFFTWRYALNARHLRVVYHELGRTKQLASELEKSRAESKRKSFFLNAVSHDLRTPLNGLMLQADLAELSARTGDLESIRESLQEIKACARTTADLLGSFLELGRLDWSDESNRETTFSAADLIGHVTNSARIVAESKGIEIRQECPAGLHLHTDRVKLERIMQNLANNAVKFTAAGRVEILVKTSGRDVVISVGDTGPGIPVEQREAIFDEFFQVQNNERDSAKGLGLGLSIARRLARQLGGDIVVESEVGRGSSFSLALSGVVEEPGSGQVIKPDFASLESSPIVRKNPASAALDL